MVMFDLFLFELRGKLFYAQIDIKCYAHTETFQKTHVLSLCLFLSLSVCLTLFHSLSLSLSLTHTHTVLSYRQTRKQAFIYKLTALHTTKDTKTSIYVQSSFFLSFLRAHMHTYLYWYKLYNILYLQTFLHKFRPKCSESHPERRAIAKQLYCGNTLPLMIKLGKLIRKISVLISVLPKVRNAQRI